ncbi:glycosyl hydrolase [Kineosporia sp. NBRC 101731]|uniref:glycosyl hydrolase n=1 Tax=Kineosporia sp. NBRC 101731 TaxID=3032199 RepID=UPI0024A42D76|nr:glycosyl hydrolase [Kineosporia sp. NBRC 101731]GLY31741.1 hypothetical protein Kisp02_51060 [Kineosporia sp. NBRC 101731]
MPHPSAPDQEERPRSRREMRELERRRASAPQSDAAPDSAPSDPDSGPGPQPSAPGVPVEPEAPRTAFGQAPTATSTVTEDSAPSGLDSLGRRSDLAWSRHRGDGHEPAQQQWVQDVPGHPGARPQSGTAPGHRRSEPAPPARPDGPAWAPPRPSPVPPVSQPSGLDGGSGIFSPSAETPASIPLPIDTPPAGGHRTTGSPQNRRDHRAPQDQRDVSTTDGRPSFGVPADRRDADPRDADPRDFGQRVVEQCGLRRNRSGTAGPDDFRPGTARPDVARPDLARPDSARPDTPRPGISRSSVSPGEPDARWNRPLPGSRPAASPLSEGTGPRNRDAGGPYTPAPPRSLSGGPTTGGSPRPGHEARSLDDPFPGAHSPRDPDSFPVFPGTRSDRDPDPFPISPPETSRREADPFPASPPETSRRETDPFPASPPDDSPREADPFPASRNDSPRADSHRSDSRRSASRRDGSHRGGSPLGDPSSHRAPLPGELPGSRDTPLPGDRPGTPVHGRRERSQEVPFTGPGHPEDDVFGFSAGPAPHVSAPELTAYDDRPDQEPPGQSPFARSQPDLPDPAGSPEPELGNPPERLLGRDARARMRGRRERGADGSGTPLPGLLGRDAENTHDTGSTQEGVRSDGAEAPRGWGRRDGRLPGFGSGSPVQGLAGPDAEFPGPSRRPVLGRGPGPNPDPHQNPGANGRRDRSMPRFDGAPPARDHLDHLDHVDHLDHLDQGAPRGLPGRPFDEDGPSLLGGPPQRPPHQNRGAGRAQNRPQNRPQPQGLRPQKKTWRDWRPHQITLRRSQVITLGLVTALVILIAVAGAYKSGRSTTTGLGASATTGPATATPTPLVTEASLKGKLGVFSGTDLARTKAFETWMGRKLTYATIFGDRETWDDIANPGEHLTEWKDSGYRVVMAVPMIPDNLNDTKLASMKDGASGDFNEYFVTLAEHLVENGQEKAILRVGWEFNLKSWPWGIEDHATYITFYRQIVTAMRSVPGQEFEFDWNPNNGYNPYDGQDYYPGDAYVDYVGVDVYDLHSGLYPYPKNCNQACKENRQTRAWNEVIFGGDRGLVFWTDFAQQHDKPISLPEWGLWDRYDGSGGQDNPLFIEFMHDYITWAPNNVAYASYFNLNSYQGEHSLTESFPQGGKKFLELFGGNKK